MPGYKNQVEFGVLTSFVYPVENGGINHITKLNSDDQQWHQISTKWTITSHLKGDS